MASPGGHMFYIGFFRDKHEKILSETIWPRALIFGVMASPLPGLFKLCPGGKKLPLPRCHQGHGQLSTDTNM